MKVINLKEASKKTGVSEVEIAKKIVEFLSIKADVYGIPQHLEMTCRGKLDARP